MSEKKIFFRFDRCCIFAEENLELKSTVSYEELKSTVRGGEVGERCCGVCQE